MKLNIQDVYTRNIFYKRNIQDDKKSSILKPNDLDSRENVDIDTRNELNMNLLN